MDQMLLRYLHCHSSKMCRVSACVFVCVCVCTFMYNLRWRFPLRNLNNYVRERTSTATEIIGIAEYEFH